MTVRASQVQKRLARRLVGKQVNVAGQIADIAEVSLKGGDIYVPANWQLYLEIKSYWFAFLSLESMVGGPELLQQCCKGPARSRRSKKKAG